MNCFACDHQRSFPGDCHIAHGHARHSRYKDVCQPFLRDVTASARHRQYVAKTDDRKRAAKRKDRQRAGYVGKIAQVLERGWWGR